MDEQQNQPSSSDGRRKRKLSPFEQFSQTYLPVVILGTTLILIAIFVFGAIIRGFQTRTMKLQLSHQAEIDAQEARKRHQEECDALITLASEYANRYDYDGAIRVLQSFSGDRNTFTVIDRLITAYEKQKNTMVKWTDLSAIPNLSFQMLIVDTERAFKADYADSYKKNFITTEEFKLILEQLYSNGYILVNMDDLYEYKTTDSGMSYFIEKELYLPNGKKPLMITQTQVNYNLYMVDSNKDMIADAGGSGFASKLIIDANGNLACEYVSNDGTVDSGAYDLIPILEAFIATHPDFSYLDARATIALSGYNGVFGYRTHAEAEKVLGTEAYNEEIEKAKLVAKKLKETGYELACYTYPGNKDYSKRSAKDITADMSGWNAEVVPILGMLDTFVFPKNGDFTNPGVSYTSEAYRVLDDAGFKIYLGYCKNGTPWSNVEDQCIRQGRIDVSAANLMNNKSWFNDILDPADVLIETR